MLRTLPVSSKGYALQPIWLKGAKFSHPLGRMRCGTHLYEKRTDSSNLRRTDGRVSYFNRPVKITGLQAGDEFVLGLNLLAAGTKKYLQGIFGVFSGGGENKKTSGFGSTAYLDCTRYLLRLRSRLVRWNREQVKRVEVRTQGIRTRRFIYAPPFVPTVKGSTSAVEEFGNKALSQNSASA